MKTSISFSSNFELYEFVDNGIYLQALHSKMPPALIVHRYDFDRGEKIRATFVKDGVYRIIGRETCRHEGRSGRLLRRKA